MLTVELARAGGSSQLMAVAVVLLMTIYSNCWSTDRLHCTLLLLTLLPAPKA